MLKTPPVLHRDPVTDLIAGARGGKKAPIELEPGVFLIGHFSLDMLIWGGNYPEGLSYEEAHHMAYPWLGEGLPTYGVCDTPQQFLDRFRGRLADDPRTFCMSFTHIPKDPTNAGQGGGWRWHKWGPYIGDGEPTTEYLDDEPEFVQGVYVYHVLQTAGPKIEDPVMVEFEARLKKSKGAQA